MGDTSDKFPGKDDEKKPAPEIKGTMMMGAVPPQEKKPDAKEEPSSKEASKKKRPAGTMMMGVTPPADWTTPEDSKPRPRPQMPGPASGEPKKTMLMGAADIPGEKTETPQPGPRPQVPGPSAGGPKKTMLMDAEAIARMNAEARQAQQKKDTQPPETAGPARRPASPQPQAQPPQQQQQRPAPRPGMPSPTRQPKGTMMYDAARDADPGREEPPSTPTVEQTPSATAGARVNTGAAPAGPKMTLLFTPTTMGSESASEDASTTKTCLRCGAQMSKDAPWCPACFTKRGIPEHGKAWGPWALSVWRTPKGKGIIGAAAALLLVAVYFLIVIIANAVPFSGSVNGRFAGAMKQYWEGKPQQAMDAFGDLQEEDGGFWSWLYDFKPGEPAYFAGRCAVNLGKPTSARTSFTNAIGRAPDDIRYHEAYRALWMMSHGDLKSFVEEYQTRFDPTKAGAQYVLGRVALDMGDLNTAKERLEDLKALVGNSPFAAILEGVYQADLGNGEKAIQLLSSVKQPTLASYISRIEIARLALAAGNPDGAKIPVTEALSIDDRWPDAFEMAGRVYLDLKDYDGAQRAFGTASALAPAWDIPRIGMARVALAKGDFAGCNDMIESALKVYPEGIEARLVQMQMYLEQQDVQQAKDLSGTLIKEFSGDYRSHVVRGEYYLLRHDFTEAAKAFEMAVKIKPDYAQGYAKLGELYSVLGRTKSAEKAMRKAVKYDPHNLMYRRALGMVLIGTEKFEAATRLYEDLLKTDADNPELWIDYGDVLAAGEKYEEARAAYEKALKVRADSIIAMLRLAGVYETLGMTIPAGDQYESALKSDPKRIETYKRYIQYILRHASVDRAKVVVRNAVNAMPDNPDPHLLMAEVCKLQNEYDLAEDEIQQAIKLAPDRGDLYNQLAALYFQQHDMKRAMSTVEAALKRYPDETSLHRFKGLLFLDKRQFRDARAELSKALELDRNDPENYAALGKYYLVVGPANRAVANFGRAIERDPTRADLYLKRAEAHKKARGPNWKWHMKRDLRKACERDSALCRKKR